MDKDKIELMKRRMDQADNDRRALVIVIWCLAVSAVANMGAAIALVIVMAKLTNS